MRPTLRNRGLERQVTSSPRKTSMVDNTRQGEGPRLSAPALEEWTRNVEHVMRGISHALNNRATALSALIELSGDHLDGEPSDTRSILRSELFRVTELANIVRTVGAPRLGVEAFAPADAAKETLIALQLHIEQRERAAKIDASNAAPVRVQRWMFVRALFALIAAATTRAAAGVSVSIVTEGDWVVTRAGGIDARVEALSPYAAEMATAMGGESLQDGACGFRLPTLAAIRQREGR